ncbi:unnamed protein product [Mytilus edulis]|uniref:Uncharacterized protein n=1 Tax=Mytilus edulis TaxID=6550 RepID=A0A8S3V9Q4_MYTED|nr:unnamed protein product [Mytilus edulis]
MNLAMSNPVQASHYPINLAMSNPVQASHYQMNTAINNPIQQTMNNPMGTNMNHHMVHPFPNHQFNTGTNLTNTMWPLTQPGMPGHVYNQNPVDVNPNSGFHQSNSRRKQKEPATFDGKTTDWKLSEKKDENKPVKSVNENTKRRSVITCDYCGKKGTYKLAASKKEDELLIRMREEFAKSKTLESGNRVG